MHTPGIKVVTPATVADARGLMKAAIRDEDPVLYLEHKKLYRHLKTPESELAAQDDVVPIGKASVKRRGTNIVLVTYGAMLYTALDAAEALSSEGIELEVIDLRSLVPLDRECILDAVRRINKVMLLHEDTRTGRHGRGNLRHHRRGSVR